MIRVGVAGAAGKMGRALIRAVAEHPEMTVTAAWERPGNPAIGHDAGILSGLTDSGVVVLDHPDWPATDVAVDFTAPEATLQLSQAAAQNGCALVIGTTGLTPEHFAALRHVALKVPMVYATNFSVGINVLWSLARQAAAILGNAFDVEIIEAHHNQKKDAPSGTAITLLEAICQGKGLDPAIALKKGRQSGLRQPGEIGVHAVRAGDIVGDHTALFAGPGERIELRHQAHSRDTLARGAVRAIAWLHGRPAGWYPMSDVLGIKAM